MNTKSLAAVTVGLLVSMSVTLAACGENTDDDEPNGSETPAPAEVQLTQENNGATVALAANGTLIVALPSNPDEGFSWAIVAPEPEFLELDGAPAFVPAGSTSPVEGAAGTEVFTLKATGVGSPSSAWSTGSWMDRWTTSLRTGST